MRDEDSPRGPRRPIDPKALDAARQYLQGALDQMNLQARVEVRAEDPEDPILEVTGDDAAEVVGKKGATLDALQLLCNRVASRAQGGDRATLTLDAAGYRARREAALQALALERGDEVVRSGKGVTLDPMPPRERRVVHMALARFPGVTTRSEGEGEARRIQILPAPKTPNGAPPRA
jgi:spoIIIJ-associated protein